VVIDAMDIVEDHVHVFLEAPPRLSPSRIVQILKSIWVCFISVEKDRCDALLGAK
jgi:REP element-mobilizing transposase RayT